MADLEGCPKEEVRIPDMLGRPAWPSGRRAPELWQRNPDSGHESEVMRTLALPFLILAAILAAYQPAWQGTPVWDDDGHITKRELQSAAGLRRIWLEPGATQQYYPVLHSAFWIEHTLWGDDVRGYHLITITLHAITAWLVFVLLRRLSVPGALLAALVFALHPVHVE